MSEGSERVREGSSETDGGPRKKEDVVKLFDVVRCGEDSGDE